MQGPLHSPQWGLASIGTFGCAQLLELERRAASGSLSPRQPSPAAFSTLDSAGSCHRDILPQRPEPTL